MSVLLSFGLCCLSISLGHTLGDAAGRLRVDLSQAIPVQCMLKSFSMISFTYRCPSTGQEVHGHVADELIEGETYEVVTCTACGGTHLINPKTGRLLEQAKK